MPAGLRLTGGSSPLYYTDANSAYTHINYENYDNVKEY